MRSTAAAFVAAAIIAAGAQAQVSFERLLNAGSEPHNWLTYSGTYASQRHTTLSQIRPSNVGDLELKWVFQAQSLESFETTPLVVDGVMYLTEAPNTRPSPSTRVPAGHSGVTNITRPRTRDRAAAA
jgi:alcohol dehydrogenase (cytochrome c)